MSTAVYLHLSFYVQEEREGCQSRMILYYVYTTEVGQTVLNQTMLAWFGPALQFYYYLHCQTNWADPCWPTKMCQCKRSIIILSCVPFFSNPPHAAFDTLALQ